MTGEITYRHEGYKAIPQMSRKIQELQKELDREVDLREMYENALEGIADENIHDLSQARYIAQLVLNAANKKREE